MGYKIVTENRDIYMDPDQATISQVFYAGVMNKNTKSVDNNYNKCGTIQVVNSATSWLTTNIVDVNNTSGKVTITATPNYTGSQRSAKLYLKNDNGQTTNYIQIIQRSGRSVTPTPESKIIVIDKITICIFASSNNLQVGTDNYNFTISDFGGLPEDDYRIEFKERFGNFVGSSDRDEWHNMGANEDNGVIYYNIQHSYEETWSFGMSLTYPCIVSTKYNFDDTTKWEQLLAENSIVNTIEIVPGATIGTNSIYVSVQQIAPENKIFSHTFTNTNSTYTIDTPIHLHNISVTTSS